MHETTPRYLQKLVSPYKRLQKAEDMASFRQQLKSYLCSTPFIVTHRPPRPPSPSPFLTVPPATFPYRHPPTPPPTPLPRPPFHHSPHSPSSSPSASSMWLSVYKELKRTLRINTDIDIIAKLPQAFDLAATWYCVD